MSDFFVNSSYLPGNKTMSHQEPPKVRFYQLSSTSLEKALVDIVNKAWKKGTKLCLMAHDPNHAQWLDDLLWRQPNDVFLPHGLWNGLDPERQPILISPEPDQRNGATLILLATPKLLRNPEKFDLVIDFVNGKSPNDLAASRQRYRHYRDLGCTMEYWAQSLQGWQKKQTSSS